MLKLIAEIGGNKMSSIDGASRSGGPAVFGYKPTNLNQPGNTTKTSTDSANGTQLGSVFYGAAQVVAKEIPRQVDATSEFNEKQRLQKEQQDAESREKAAEQAGRDRNTDLLNALGLESTQQQVHTQAAGDSGFSGPSTTAAPDTTTPPTIGDSPAPPSDAPDRAFTGPPAHVDVVA